MEVTKICVQIYGDFNQQGIHWLACYNSLGHDVSSLKVSSRSDFSYLNEF